MTFDDACAPSSAVAWHKNRDEIGACAKFGGNFELKFCACADFVAIFVPSNLQSSVDYVTGIGNAHAHNKQLATPSATRSVPLTVL